MVPHKSSIQQAPQMDSGRSRGCSEDSNNVAQMNYRCTTKSIHAALRVGAEKKTDLWSPELLEARNK